MKILGISGYAGHGKNYLASHLQSTLGGQIIHLADALKAMCAEIFQIPLKIFYHAHYKNQSLQQLGFSPINIDDYILVLSHRTGFKIMKRRLTATTPRELLQFIGTEYVRSIQESFWAEQLVQAILANPQVPCWYVPDVRFLDEWLYLKKHFGDDFQLIQVFRPDIPFNSHHASERPDLLTGVIKGWFCMRTNEKKQLQEITQLLAEQFLGI